MAEAPRGRIRERPEDFVVEEIAAYEPSGEGEHVFVRLTKTNVTTIDAVRMVAAALGCDPREAGFAGMKDKRAVATQTVSMHAPRGVRPHELAARARCLSLPSIAVHDAVPHGHKLKAGHLAGNRFAIVVRDVEPERIDEAAESLGRAAREGLPNAFGAQRFGKAGDNVTRALAWLRGQERGPRDPKVQRLLWSSVQSAVFNAVLDARVRDGTWATALAGDLLKLRTSGGLFVCEDVEADRPRAGAGDVSPTGPIAGAKMRWPEGSPGALERREATAILGEDFDFARTRRLGEGSRRALRLWIEQLRWERADDDTAPFADLQAAGNATRPGHRRACMRVYFVLPKGAYATTVLAAAFTVDEARAPQEEPPPQQDETEGTTA